MDTSLKQRLIGAIVLVALAVIFLPMLIKGPAPDSGVSDVSLRVPAAPAGEYETRELPLVTPATPASGNSATGLVPGPDGGTETGSTAVTTPLQENPDAADLAVPATAGQALPPSVAAGKYAVNFGAYATPADADKVVAHLRQSQLPGYSEATTVNDKPAWRVRIGPYTTQAQAESVRLQAAKVRSDVRAQVVTLDATPSAAEAPAPALPKPAATAQAKPATPTGVKPTETTTAAKPAETRPATKPAEAPKAATTKPAEVSAAGKVGFAVQLGAFASAEEANSLRDRARAAGFSAFVEQVRTDKGMLSRVRVGPVADRDDAEKLKAQVATKLGIGGMVRPHP